MICFSYLFKKNYFSFGAWPIMTPFCANWAQKTIFKRFYQLFFRTTGLQHKLLTLIESPNIFYWKSTKKSKVGVVFGIKFGTNLVQCCEKTKKNWYFNGFFYILHEVYIYKHKVVLTEIPE